MFKMAFERILLSIWRVCHYPQFLLKTFSEIMQGLFVNVENCP